MKKHIEKIKQRPVHERKKLATIFAVVVTLIIVIMSVILGSVFKTENKVQNNNAPSSFEKVLTGIEDKFSEIGDDFKEQKEIESKKSQINIGTDEDPVYVDSLEEQIEI